MPSRVVIAILHVFHAIDSLNKQRQRTSVAVSVDKKEKKKMLLFCEKCWITKTSIDQLQETAIAFEEVPQNANPIVEVKHPASS